MRLLEHFGREISVGNDAPPGTSTISDSSGLESCPLPVVIFLRPRCALRPPSCRKLAFLLGQKRQRGKRIHWRMYLGIYMYIWGEQRAVTHPNPPINQDVTFPALEHNFRRSKHFWNSREHSGVACYITQTQNAGFCLFAN